MERRVHLSATVEYRPQKPDGTLETPVIATTRQPVQDFTPEQLSILQRGFTESQHDLFLKLTNIQGESNDDRHPGEIELVSFSWGENATHASSAGQVTVGASRFHEVHVVKRMSKASPKLLQAMTDGTIIADGSLVVGKPGDKPLDFLRLDLKNVRVSSYQLRPATDGSNALLEEFTLSFEQVAMEYRSQKADGTLDSPVVFQGQAPVEDFAPQQRSLLDDGIVNAPGLSQFLTIDGILGESQDIAHRDAIDVRTFRWGGDQAFALGGGGATIGRVTLHELHVVANVSKASPNLMGRMSTGTVIPTATLAVAHPSGAGDFYKLTLTNALVSSYRVTTGPAGELIEEFTLAFTGTRAEYSAPLPNGKLDSPVVFQGAQVAVQDFDPPQTSELHDGSLVDGSLDFFLQLDGIPGESTDARHPNEIELVSFGWGGDLTYGSSGGSTGVSSLHELRVVMPITKATPKLMQAIANGTHIPTAKLSVQRLAGRGGGDVYSIALENLVVSSHQLTTAANGRLMEEVSLAFSKVELTYRPQKADGSLDTPVVFQRTGAPVEAYAAEQRALLDEGHVPLSGLDAFLRVDGILGESMDVDHKDQIDVLSFEWGADHAFALGGGGGGVGRTQFHELHVVSHVSRASPKLMEAMVQGKAIAAADLFVRKAGDNPQEFFKVTLENVIVSSYQVKPSPRGEMLEEYTLSFNEARVEYRAQKADGSLEPPVVFQQAVTNVEDFEPEQLALIDRELGVLPHDIVLRLPGIPGESTLNGYAGQIDVESFSWGGDARLGLIGGGEVGAPELRELHLVSRVSKASPKLIDALAKGTQLADAELSFVATATRGERFMRITLKDVLVSSYQTTTDNNGTLMEEVTLLFLDSEWEYRRLQSNGSVGTPVIFAAQRIPVEDFAPTQRSILPGAPLIPTLQAFIEIDGIPGESTDSAHEDEIDVLSFSWGADATFGTGGGGGIPVGRSQFHEVHFVARTSRATPRVLDRLTQGKHVADARLVLRKGGDKPAEFFTITLADVVVSSYQVTTAEDGYLLEEITLAYGPGDAEPPTAVTLTGTAGADTFYLRRSGTGIAVFDNDTGTGTPIQIVGAGQGILVNTLAGDDRLIIDQSAGDLVVPNGIQFTGGDGVDTLRIINATGNAAINEQGVTTVGNTQVNHGAIENVELNGILIGLLLPAVQTLKVAGNDGLLTVQGLNLGAGARLDLGTNDLRILGSDVASIEELMKTARNGAAPWQGPGIGTSAATALTGLAAVQQGPDVLVRFTYNGDANVDGRINADDYFLIDSGFLERPANPPYARGDFNFDDAINADDYFLIDSAFLGQAQPLGEASSGSIPTSATLQPAVAPAAPFYSADARNHVKRRARARFSDTVISSTGRAETHARKLVAPTRGN